VTSFKFDQIIIDAAISGSDAHVLLDVLRQKEEILNTKYN